jgi:hypothetical protein
VTALCSVLHSAWQLARLFMNEEVRVFVCVCAVFGRVQCVVVDGRHKLLFMCATSVFRASLICLISQPHFPAHAHAPLHRLSLRYGAHTAMQS